MSRSFDDIKKALPESVAAGVVEMWGSLDPRLPVANNEGCSDAEDSARRSVGAARCDGASYGEDVCRVDTSGGDGISALDASLAHALFGTEDARLAASILDAARGGDGDRPFVEGAMRAGEGLWVFQAHEPSRARVIICEGVNNVGRVLAEARSLFIDSAGDKPAVQLVDRPEANGAREK